MSVSSEPSSWRTTDATPWARPPPPGNGRRRRRACRLAGGRKRRQLRRSARRGMKAPSRRLDGQRSRRSARCVFCVQGEPYDVQLRQLFPQRFRGSPASMMAPRHVTADAGKSGRLFASVRPAAVASARQTARGLEFLGGHPPILLSGAPPLHLGLSTPKSIAIAQLLWWARRLITAAR
jgi:hypothetical protein